jgi:hypothetical protein
MGEGTVDSAARGEAATEAMFVGSDGGRFESEYQKRRRVVRLLKETAQETSDMNVKEVEVKVTFRVTRCPAQRDLATRSFRRRWERSDLQQ